MDYRIQCFGKDPRGNIDMIIWEAQKYVEKAVAHTNESKMPNYLGRWWKKGLKCLQKWACQVDIFCKKTHQKTVLWEGSEDTPYTNKCVVRGEDLRIDMQPRVSAGKES